ncbi:hypothetical protein PYCCODRAFT_1467438 [Trametes coccinea BRFM310]|uniref:Protein PBN1 n=1 Tax=Trametes coccinea (strain BRFM310) TaxID=1353009 RepID=A0A1Y2IPY1_TRAC3|nr:hypothetical protein PYCCODRAFT_1467438 [Trametes coccinea BRFM310]
MASLSSRISGDGFHFTVSTTIHIPDTLDLTHRTLHVVHDLDPHIYADQYELAQRPGYSSVLWGTTDLEKPVSAVPQNGSVLLLTADTSHVLSGTPVNLTLEVPLHARYGRPVAGADEKDTFYHIHLRRPIGFVAGEIGSAAEMPAALRPYASFHGWPSPPLSLIPDTAPNDPMEVIIPVGVLQHLAWVDVGTAVVMIAMFFYLLHAALRTARRLSVKVKVSTKTE